MPVFIEEKFSYRGVVSIPALDQEVVVVEIPGQTDDYMAEGWLDLSALRAGDVLDVREYVAVDGVNYRLYMWRRFYGPLAEPVIRFHTKMFQKDMKVKITVEQKAGTPRSLYYTFIIEVLATG